MKILNNGDGYLTPQELQELQDLMDRVKELADRADQMDRQRQGQWWTPQPNKFYS